MTPQAVSNWETIEGRGPSRDVLPRLAAALNTTVDDLLATGGADASEVSVPGGHDIETSSTSAQEVTP